MPALLPVVKNFSMPLCRKFLITCIVERVARRKSREYVEIPRGPVFLEIEQLGHPTLLLGLVERLTEPTARTLRTATYGMRRYN